MDYSNPRDFPETVATVHNQPQQGLVSIVAPADRYCAMKIMTHRLRLYFLLFLELFLLVESKSQINASRILAKASPEALSRSDQCQSAGKCEMCTSSDLRASPACKETGRRQKFQCSFDDSNGGEAENTTYRSCKQTEVDEEFAMVRFQMFCFLLGSMAFASVKKQKRLSASLFDQRKRGVQLNSRHQRDTGEEVIEFSRIEEESVPLVHSSSNPLEVI